MPRIAVISAKKHVRFSSPLEEWFSLTPSPEPETKAKEEPSPKKAKRNHEPYYSNRKIIPMTIVCYGAKEIPVRVLLDPRASGPVISEDLVKRWKIPYAVRTIPKPLEAFNTIINLDSKKTYTKEVVLRHQAEHFSRISFEILPLDRECDILLPY